MQVPNQTKYAGGTNRGGDDAARDGASPGRPPAPRWPRRAQPQPVPAARRRGSSGEGEGCRRLQRAGGPASGPGKGRRRPRERGHGLHPSRESVRAEHATFFWIRRETEREMLTTRTAQDALLKYNQEAAWPERLRTIYSLRLPVLKSKEYNICRLTSVWLNAFWWAPKCKMWGMCTSFSWLRSEGSISHEAKKNTHTHTCREGELLQSSSKPWSKKNSLRRARQRTHKWAQALGMRRPPTMHGWNWEWLKLNKS